MNEPQAIAETPDSIPEFIAPGAAVVQLAAAAARRRGIVLYRLIDVRRQLEEELTRQRKEAERLEMDRQRVMYEWRKTQESIDSLLRVQA